MSAMQPETNLEYVRQVTAMGELIPEIFGPSTPRKRFELMYEHAAEAKLALWVKMCTPRRREQRRVLTKHHRTRPEARQSVVFTNDRENALPAQAGAHF